MTGRKWRYWSPWLALTTCVAVVWWRVYRLWDRLLTALPRPPREIRRAKTTKGGGSR